MAKSSFTNKISFVAIPMSVFIPEIKVITPVVPMIEIFIRSKNQCK